MAKNKESGSAKRYGTRYGRTTRQKVGTLERDVRIRQVCPFCTKRTVKRVAAGIWGCKSCGSKFTGAAYTLKKEIKAEVVETNG